MRTQSKDKLEKALRLYSLIQARLEIEKEESELKDYFKVEIKDGLLEAGEIIITLENKSRTSLDKKSLEQEMGAAFVKQFERQAEYVQLNVKKRVA